MLNKIVVMGRLVKEPELRMTQQQTPVASFTLACERDRDRETSDFLDCVAWKGTAEFVSKYFTKGQLVAVSGRLQSRKWEDRDGNKRINWEIVADSVYFAEPKRAADIPAERPAESGLKELPDDDGDLPFWV